MPLPHIPLQMKTYDYANIGLLVALPDPQHTANDATCLQSTSKLPGQKGTATDTTSEFGEV